MSKVTEIVDRNHEFGKKSDPIEQALAHEISNGLIAYLDYMRSQPGYSTLTEIQANLTKWMDPKHVPGESYTLSIVHKIAETPK